MHFTTLFAATCATLASALPFAQDDLSKPSPIPFPRKNEKKGKKEKKNTNTFPLQP